MPVDSKLTSVLRRRLLLLALLLLAFGLRVIALNRTPPGLSHDEAYNGIAALEVLAGQFRIFYDINKGIEPLIIWLEGLAFAAWGIGPWQMRLVNVLAGMLTVVLVYPLAARLFNRRVALLALAGLAVSFWAVFVSRLTLRAVLLPPLLLAALYFWWLALNPQIANRKLQIANNRSPFTIHHSPFTILFFLLSGLFTGLAMYTYISSRVLPLILLALFGYQLLRRHITRQHWLGLLLWAMLLLALSAPLGNYYRQHADTFSRRADQVSTLPYLRNGDPGPLLKNTARTLAMFNVTGDTTDRYNLDGRPVFDWLNGLLFLLGVGLLLWRFLRAPLDAPAPFLLLSATVITLLPDFVTDDSPHFLRTIGALPLVYILWAVGLVAALDWLAKRLATRHTPHALHITHYAPALLILLMTLHTITDYFSRWHNAPDARLIYGADIAEVARYLQSSDADGLPAISAAYYRDLDRFRLQLHSGNQPPFAIWFDGRQSLAFPPPESGLSPRYIFPASAPAPEAWQALLRFDAAASGQAFSLYHAPEAAPVQRLLADAAPVNVAVNDDMVVRGVRILGRPETGRQLQLLLIWQALRALPPGTDYTFAVELRDSQGRVWQQTDGNGYDPGDWQPGIVGLQLLTFRLPGDLPPRTYALTGRVVNRQTQAALPTETGSTDIPLGQVAITLAETPRQVDPARLPNPLPAAPPVDDTGLQLRGFELARSVSPGELLPLTLHWQVARQPAQDYRLHLFLADAAGRALYRWPPLSPLDGEWPTTGWPAGYWVQDRLALPITTAAPAGSHSLRLKWLPVGASTPADSAGSYNLGQIELNPAQ